MNKRTNSYNSDFINSLKKVRDIFENKLGKRQRSLSIPSYLLIRTSENNSFDNQLCSAIKSEDYLKVENLLNSGQDPNVNNPGQMTPLAIAITSNNLRMVEILLKKGAAPNSRTFFKPSQLQNDQFFVNNFKVNAEKLEKLKENMAKVGFDLNNTDLWNEPVLNIAVKNSNVKILISLLDNGANPNKVLKDIFVEEPLLEAVTKKDVNIASILLQKGADPDAPMESKVTKAIMNNDDKMLKLLIEKGANTYYREGNGLSPLLASISRNTDTCLDIVLEKSRVDLIKTQMKIDTRKIEISKMTDRKQVKRETVTLFAMIDRLTQYKDIMNYGLTTIFRDSRFNADGRILKIIATRDNLNVGSLSKEQVGKLLQTEMNEMFNRYYFQKPLIKPYENLEQNREDYIMDEDKILRTKKYKPSEILKKFTYLEKVDIDKDRVATIYDKLEKYNDFHISSLLTWAALNAVQQPEYGKGLIRVYVAKSGSGSITPLLYNANPKGVILGMTDLSTNKVFFSRILRESESSRTFIHELTHAVCKVYKDRVSVAQYRKDYKDLGNAVQELKRKIAQLQNDSPEKFNSKDHTSPESMIKASIDRVEKASTAYFFDAYANEDVLCDMMAAKQYSARHPERKREVEKLVEPLYRFLDNVIMPKMLENIRNHPALDVVELPEIVKTRLFERSFLRTI